MIMHAVSALILALLDAAVGTVVFVRGHEWSRILHFMQFVGRVDVADLWAVSVHVDYVYEYM